MLEESEARSRVLGEVESGPVVWLPIFLARDLVSAQEIRALVDFPEFDNSSMDGYAVRAGEAGKGATLCVLGDEQPAGVDRELELPPGAAIRIFTGAPVPAGSDAVIMQEDVVRTDDRIEIMDPVVSGENIRRRGGDVCAGQTIVPKGKVLNTTTIALLASQGIAEVAVHVRPMVHVVTTGDELIQLGEYRMPGQIFDSNGILLRNAAEEAGGVAEQVHVPDNPDLMREAFEILCQVSDVLVIAGGVSVGDRDFVKGVLNDIGVETNFWRIRLKPGKPFLFGKHPDGCLVFGLPGNPVSAYVTFRLFVAPAIEARMGKAIREEKGRDARVNLGVAGEAIHNDGDRPHYLRGVIEDGVVQLSGTQQSHALFGLSKANCLVRLEPGQTVEVGEPLAGLRI